MKGVIFVMVACLFWAFDTLIRYPLIGSYSVEKIIFYEHLLLAAIFVPVIWKRRSIWWEFKVDHLFSFLVIGGLGSALGSICFTASFKLINPSLVILLQELQPIVAIVLARLVLKEEIQKKFLLWAIPCIVGGLLVSHKGLLTYLQAGDFSNILSAASLKGYGLALSAVFCWGTATVFGKKLSSSGVDEKDIMAGRFFIGLMVMVPFFFQAPSPLILGSVVDYGKIVLLAVLSGLIAMTFYYQGLKRISARLCALVEMFFPFCAVAINWLFLDASLDGIQLLGGALLIVGSAVIQLRHY